MTLIYYHLKYLMVIGNTYKVPERYVEKENRNKRCKRCRKYLRQHHSKEGLCGYCNEEMEGNRKLTG